MDPHLAAYLDWLRGWDIPFHLAGGLAKDPDYRGPHPSEGDSPHAFTLGPGLEPVTEHRDVAGGFSADHATRSAALAMAQPEIWRGAQTVWEVGCGTGVLCVVAARLGAQDVVGSDVCPEAIALAKINVEPAAEQVRLRVGRGLDAFEAELAAPDLVVANLPHKPTCETEALPVGQDGGANGMAIHAEHATQAASRMTAGARVLLFLHSLPHPHLLAAYAEHFDLELVRWKRRLFGADEYGTRHDVFEARARAGTSLLIDHDGARGLVAGVWMGTRR